METNGTTGLLSERGNVSAAPAKKQLIFDIINNLWHPETNPDGYVSLGVAENALMHEEMAQFIKKSFDIPEVALTYGDGGTGSKRLRAALSRFITRKFEPVSPVKPEHITVTNGVTTSIEECAWGLGDPGDGFLLGRPYYGSFPHDLGERAGVKAVSVNFDSVDPLSIEAVAKYEDALHRSEKAGTKVKALLLCSPHNPLGRCYSREILIAYMRFCQKYRIHFICDEIYALSVYENIDFPQAPTFTSVISIDPSGIISPELVHILWGMSKDFGANGLRLGCVISQSNPAFVRSLQAHSLYTYPSSVSDHITANVLEDDDFVDWYVVTNQARLADSYRYTVDCLRRNDIPFASGSNAAFFVWADLGGALPRTGTADRAGPDVQSLSLSDTGDNGNADGGKKSRAEEPSDITTHIMSKLLSEKVFLASGEAFGSERPGWFRIVFSQPRDYLEEGLRRMLKAIQQ